MLGSPDDISGGWYLFMEFQINRNAVVIPDRYSSEASCFRIMVERGYSAAVENRP
jgi:hypothetical protein